MPISVEHAGKAHKVKGQAISGVKDSVKNVLHKVTTLTGDDEQSDEDEPWKQEVLHGRKKTAQEKTSPNGVVPHEEHGANGNINYGEESEANAPQVTKAEEIESEGQHDKNGDESRVGEAKSKTDGT